MTIDSVLSNQIQSNQMTDQNDLKDFLKYNSAEHIAVNNQSDFIRFFLKRNERWEK